MISTPTGSYFLTVTVNYRGIEKNVLALLLCKLENNLIIMIPWPG